MKKGNGLYQMEWKDWKSLHFWTEILRRLMEISGDKGGKKIIKKHPEDVAYLQIRNARELQDADEPDVFTAGNPR